MIITTAFDIGQTVFLKTDPDQRPHIITGISIRDNNLTSYCLAHNTEDHWHYDCEIQAEQNQLTALK